MSRGAIMGFRVAFPRRLLLGVLLLLGWYLGTGSAGGMYPEVIGVCLANCLTVDYNSGYETENQNVFDANHAKHASSDPSDLRSSRNPLYAPMTAANALQELHAALSVMQDQYFSLWLGKWTTAIDWTAAMTSTHLSASLYSLSHSLSYTLPGTFDKARKLDVEAQMVENEINKYFAHSMAYYFGEDHLAIRMQAYDDMLWVVLGWLESIHFIKSHSNSHYTSKSEDDERKVRGKEWHGKQFIPVFAHRARIFYELAEEGWDWKLCGGGMTWNPRLLPYKNAITNELFISASVSMYLHFPGDDNCSPFIGAEDADEKHPDWKRVRAQHQEKAFACPSSTSGSTYNPIYLANAINGYDWLRGVNMTNEDGLYVDGFHIKDYDKNNSKTECNERNEMVYTYNQGVILSGLHGLWEATGNITYLEDGHELVRNVIRATGWTGTDITPFTSFNQALTASPLFRTLQRLAVSSSKVENPTTLSISTSLGSHGILEEFCDSDGTCNQDGQMFKSIFFHHLTTFCATLPASPARPGKTYGASRQLRALHRRSCNEYTPWILHNGQAALKTKDARGRFGGWWGASLARNTLLESKGKSPGERLPRGALDYRNGISDAEYWGGEQPGTKFHATMSDPNERGRGRTIETQGGGVAVTRAMWEFLRIFEDEV